MLVQAYVKNIGSFKGDGRYNMAIEITDKRSCKKYGQVWDDEIKRCDLSWSKFRNATLNDADLRDADMEYAVMHYTKLSKVDMRNANLERSFLDEANMRWASLVQADLTNANLSRAKLKDAIIPPETLDGACKKYSAHKGVCIKHWEF